MVDVASVPAQKAVAEHVTLPVGVTADSLRTAVAASRSWRGVLRALGMTSAHRGRQLQTACARLGIDVSHFSVRTWTDDQLDQVISSAPSWSDVLRRLGYARDSGSARATIRKHAARLGLDISTLAEPPDRAAGGPFTDPPLPENLRAAGAYFVAGACALAGYKVSWPLEPAVYDLLVDTGRIQRVQVKTTTWRKDNTWACKITHNRSSEKAWYSDEEIDFFAVVDPDVNVYMIPVAAVDGLGTIYVRRYEAYRLGRLDGAAAH